MTDAEIATHKPKPRKLFYLILVCLPFVILAAVEFGLRLANYGTSYPLFVPVSSDNYDGYLRPNPDILKRYFSHPSLAPNISPDSFYFKNVKDKDTFRIVVQGGSTAAGFPYGHSGSLAGMLHQRFKRLYPEKNIEIVSTAMAAVNSYMLLDFTDDIIAIEPDLVLIYAGHNEFLGIMGVGSAFASKGGRGANLTYLKMRDLKLFQLMQQIIFSVQSGGIDTEAPKLNQTNNLMRVAAREKEIPLGSELYQRGIEQFTGNMELILNKYGAANIPVYLATLVSNEKDLKPFSSEPGDDGADAYYARAKSMEKDNQYEAALRNYHDARDRDLLRFRAPSEFNNIIRNKAELAHVSLVDVEEHFRFQIPNRIIGNNMMLEHLHPNRQGYFLLADAFVDKIVSEKIISDTHDSFPKQSAWFDIPITRVTNLIGENTVKVLMSDYPFTETKQEVDFGDMSSFEAQKAFELMNNANWLDTHFAMVDHYYDRKDDSEAARVAALISDYYPKNAEIAALAGDIYMFKRDPQMALYYHKRAIAQEPTNVKYLMSSVGSFLMTGQPQKSLELLDKVLQIEPDNQQASGQRARLLQVLEQQ